MRLHVVIAVHEAARWHDACLTSLRQQLHEDWRAVVVVDPGTDGTREIAERHAAEEPRLTVLAPRLRQWQLANRKAGWQHLDPPETGVIVLLDGDDRWVDTNALSTLAAAFANTATWLTYGSHHRFSCRGRRAERRFAGNGPWRSRLQRTEPYPAAALAAGTVRTLGWRAGHPLAFRRFLADAVREEDLRDCEGRYLRAATDVALTYPMLEMAGPDHVRSLDDVLYLYNTCDAGRIARQAPGAQRRARQRIEGRAPYERLVRPDVRGATT